MKLKKLLAIGLATVMLAGTPGEKFVFEVQAEEIAAEMSSDDGMTEQQMEEESFFAEESDIPDENQGFSDNAEDFVEPQPESGETDDVISAFSDGLRIAPAAQRPTWVLGNGYVGKVAWYVYADGTLEIKGSGEMRDFANQKEAPWYSYNSKINKIVISENVTSIGNYAFAFSNAKTIEINSRITRIGDYAFYDVINAKIEIPDSVKIIGNRAFHLCKTQAVLNLKSVESIGCEAFTDNSTIIKIILSGGDIKLEPYALFRINNLSELTISGKNIDIGEKAFMSCGELFSVKIKGENTTLNKSVFLRDDSLENLVIEGGTLSGLECMAFSFNRVLKGVTVPRNIVNSDSKAFALVRCIRYPGTKEEWDRFGFKLEYSETVYYNYDPLHKHDYELVTVSEANCTSDGQTDKVCKYCGDRRSLKIPAKGHTIVTKKAVEATCEEAGITEGSYCAVCNAVMKRQEKIPALGHSWDSGTIISEATCQSDGKMGYVCTRCGQTKEEKIPALGHLWNQKKIIKKCTCTENGEEEYTCQRCAQKKYEVIYSYGHVYVGDRGYAPTCENTGLTDGSHCGVCGKVLEAQKEISATGHKSVTDKKVEATCEKTGLTQGSHCEVCGKVLEAQKEIPATGHKPVTDKKMEATCEKPGLTDGSHCGVCGKVLEAQKEISAIGHKPVTDKKVEATCENTGLTEGSHCEVCGKVLEAQKEISATGHKPVTDKKVEATCEKTGLTEGSHCGVCGKVLEAQREIPATGHKPVTDKKVEATCENTGLTEGSHCGICNKVLKKQETTPAKGHTWGEWKVVRAATASSEGEEQRSCTACGKAEKRSIAKLPQIAAPVIPSSLTIAKGKSAALKPASWKKVKYKSSNKKVATVDKKGKVKAVATGTAKITVTSGKKKAVCTIIVPGTTAIKGIKGSVSLKKGKKYTLKPILSYLGKPDNITYKSSNKKIATVSGNGVVKAKKKGTATITIRSGKITKKCKVKVK